MQEVEAEALVEVVDLDLLLLEAGEDLLLVEELVVLRCTTVVCQSRSYPTQPTQLQLELVALQEPQAQAELLHLEETSESLEVTEDLPLLLVVALTSSGIAQELVELGAHGEISELPDLELVVVVQVVFLPEALHTLFLLAQAPQVEQAVLEEVSQGALELTEVHLVLHFPFLLALLQDLREGLLELEPLVQVELGVVEQEAEEQVLLVLLMPIQVEKLHRAVELVATEEMVVQGMLRALELSEALDLLEPQASVDVVVVAEEAVAVVGQETQLVALAGLVERLAWALLDS